MFVRRDHPRIAGSAWEETRAFFSSGELWDSDLVFSTGAAESVIGLFAQGKELLSAEAAWGNGREHMRIMSGMGLLLLEHTSSLGMRRCCIHSLAHLEQTIGRAQSTVKSWKARGARINRITVRPEIAPLARVWPSFLAAEA